MNALISPRLDCPIPATNGPHDADPAHPAAAVGAPNGVAEGVRSALRSDTQAADGRFPVAWLTIVAPYGATPTATSKCLCGRDRSAVGRVHVLALIEDHTTHRSECPLRAPREGRTAA